MVGSRQSNLRSDNPQPTAAPPVLRPSVKFFAIFTRILTAANRGVAVAEPAELMQVDDMVIYY